MTQNTEPQDEDVPGIWSEHYKRDPDFIYKCLPDSIVRR